MINFFLKKNFCDGWDNTSHLIIPNVIIDVLVLIAVGFIFLTDGLAGSEKFQWVAILVQLIVILLVFVSASVFALAWGKNAAALADFETIEVRDLFRELRGCLKDGIAYGSLLFIIFMLTLFAIPFYFRQGTFISLLAGGMFCWIDLFIFMAVMWYPAVRSLLHDNFRKSIKKCFVILFDNLGTSIFITLYNIVLAVISVVLLGVAPGVAGLTLARVNACRLILKKYDYIEEVCKEKTSDQARPKIPWNIILKEDMESLGSRSFKSFFMPWKD